MARRAWLLYASQKGILTKQLDLNAFVRQNAIDHSTLVWAEFRYHWPQFDAALQWQRASSRIIGSCLLFRPLIRVALFLLFLQMPGTFLPLILMPETCFTHVPWAPTMEGQYIIKNLVLIAAAIVVGATVRGGRFVPREK